MPETLHRFRSAALGNERDIWVRQPPQGVLPRSLVFFLDAEFYRERVEAPSVVETLEKTGKICPVLSVYVSSAGPARRIECPSHPPFVTFISDELMPWLETLHPGTRASAERVLAGLSYTGLAASYIALLSGALFTTVISQSGSYWSRDEWLTRQFAALSAPLPVRFYLDVGKKETQEPVQDEADVHRIVSQVDAVRRFREALVVTGHEVHYQEFDGGHEFHCWRQTLPDALRWALPRGK